MLGSQYRLFCFPNFTRGAYINSRIPSDDQNSPRLNEINYFCERTYKRDRLVIRSQNISLDLYSSLASNRDCLCTAFNTASAVMSVSVFKLNSVMPSFDNAGLEFRRPMTRNVTNSFIRNFGFRSKQSIHQVYQIQGYC